MKMLTTKKLIEVVKLSSRTLSRYVSAGWIAKPVFKSSGRYGASLYWLAATAKRLEVIKSLKKSGYKNKDIDRILRGVK